MAVEAGAKTLVNILAEFIHDLTYAGLPDQVKDIAKTRILDALGSAFAGRDLPHSRVAVDFVRNGRGECTIFGHHLQVPAQDAALANSVLTHSILQEDMIIGGAHPSTMVLPAALAVAEQERASGTETLMAIILGYEITGRLMRANGPVPGTAFRGGPVFGTLGTATAAARLLKLSAEQVAHTLGYAASLAPACPNEGWWSGTMETMFEAGMAARTGVLAASLAKVGATASPEVLEGRHGFFRCWSASPENASKAAERLGESFIIARTVVKPYPACGANQMPIQIASPLAKLGLKPQDIVKVVERTRPEPGIYAGNNFAGPFQNQFQAQMSLQFCAAATLLGHPMTSYRFYAEHYDDPEVNELARKVEPVFEEGRTFDVRFEVHTSDGRMIVAEEDPVDRSRHLPTVAGMQERFRALAADYLGEKRTGEIIDLVMGLDRVDDVRRLTRLLGK